MLITSIEKVTITYHEVTIDGQCYARYDPDNWDWLIGNSKEMVSYPEKLEEAFQRFRELSC